MVWGVYPLENGQNSKNGLRLRLGWSVYYGENHENCMGLYLGFGDGTPSENSKNDENDIFVKIVWACGWGRSVYYGENCKSVENGDWGGFVYNSENCENGIGLLPWLGVGTPRKW